MDDCIFCKIVSGDIPADIVAENDVAIAIRDIQPQMPVHDLVIPKRHIRSLQDLDDEMLGGRLLSLAIEVARKEGVAETGYRLLTNDGEAAGQTVFHLHFHVLGGRPLGPGLV